MTFRSKAPSKLAEIHDCDPFFVRREREREHLGENDEKSPGDKAHGL